MIVKIRTSYAPSAGINPKARLPTLNDFKEKEKNKKHICSFTEQCTDEVHDCPHVEVSNHCESHCWHGEM